MLATVRSRLGPDAQIVHSPDDHKIMSRSRAETLLQPSCIVRSRETLLEGGRRTLALLVNRRITKGGERNTVILIIGRALHEVNIVKSRKTDESSKSRVQDT